MKKYFNVPTEIDGIKFDSIKESEYYLYLKSLKKEGEIKEFTLQPKFELQAGFEKDGCKYRPINYISDFDVTYADGRREIVDVKGVMTDVFKMKAKMFDFRYPDLTLVLV